MQALLDYCKSYPRTGLAAGSVLLNEGDRTGKLIVLVEGTVEVHRAEVQIALINEPGAVFGEMSALLDIPHTTSVRAVTPVVVNIFENAREFLEANPGLNFPIATLLARRLQGATTYLVDLKRQFGDQKDHLGMVDEVLESIIHEQGEAFPPSSDLPIGP